MRTNFSKLITWVVTLGSTLVSMKLGFPSSTNMISRSVIPIIQWNEYAREKEREGEQGVDSSIALDRWG